MHCSGRMHKLNPRDEQTLVQKVYLTTTKELVKKRDQVPHYVQPPSRVPLNSLKTKSESNGVAITKHSPKG